LIYLQTRFTQFFLCDSKIESLYFHFINTNLNFIIMRNSEETKLDEVWVTPEITMQNVNEKTEGDPTIGDDGLGDGLFS